MASDDFGGGAVPEEEDPYRKRVLDKVGGGSGGIAGPDDGGFAGPAMTTNRPEMAGVPNGMPTKDPVVLNDWQKQNTTGGSMAAGGYMGGQPGQPAAPGGYDLEKFRKAWYGQGDVNNIQGWLDQNKGFTNGVTLKNEKAYDPSGKFIADLVGNYSGADKSQRTAIFLDGVGHPTAGKPKVGGPITSGPGGMGGGGVVTSAAQTVGKPKVSVPPAKTPGGPKNLPPATVAPPRTSGPLTPGGPTNLPPGGPITPGGPRNLPPGAPGAPRVGGPVTSQPPGVGGPMHPGVPTPPPPGAPPPTAPPPPPTGDPQPPTAPPPTGEAPPVYDGPEHTGGQGGNPKGGGAPVEPAANDFLTQIRQAVTDRLGKMSGDVSINGDPALAAQSGAFRQARERGATQQRQAAAERAAANGTLQGGQSSGAFDTTIGGIAEGAGQDVASNDAQLMGQEVQARREEVQNLLNMAMQSGDNESARALQEKLGNLDAQLRREGLSENARQYNSSFGENQRQFGMNFGENQRQYNADDSYRYAGLNQNQRQFDSSLGENKRQFNSTDKYRYKTLDEQRRQFNDQFGRSLGRDYEDDYFRRVLMGMGGS